MATETPELSRAGTMEVTAQVGQQFLDKNLTEWKKPYLMDHFDGSDGQKEENNKSDGHSSAEANNVDAAKPNLSKHTTMVETAKEAEQLLEKSGKPDEDAHTRGQQKKIEELQAEEPAAKKPKVARDSTMAATAKEGKELIGDEKLGDTRGETKSRRGRRSGVTKGSTMNKAIEEAKELYGDIDVTSERRSLRKRPDPPKPEAKRAGTMQRTAKEGKEFVRGTGRGRGRGRPRKSTNKDDDEEKEEDEEEKKEEEDKDDKKEESDDKEASEDKEDKPEEPASSD